MSKPLLGRCKECDYALFALPDQVREAGVIKDVRETGVPYRLGTGNVFARCDKRHKVFILKPVKGTYSAVHKCDSRCLNARGHACTCSCGGANHGRGYAVRVQGVASQTADLATDPQKVYISNLLRERQLPQGDYDSVVERLEKAHKLLAEGTFTKRQASATIDWLLSLPKKSEAA